MHAGQGVLACRTPPELQAERHPVCDEVSISTWDRNAVIRTSEYACSTSGVTH